MKAKGIIYFQEKDKSGPTWVESEVLIQKCGSLVYTQYMLYKDVNLSQYNQAGARELARKIFLIVLGIFCPDKLMKPDNVTTAHLAS